MLTRINTLLLFIMDFMYDFVESDQDYDVVCKEQKLGFWAKFRYTKKRPRDFVYHKKHVRIHENLMFKRPKYAN